MRYTTYAEIMTALASSLDIYQTRIANRAIYSTEACGNCPKDLILHDCLRMSTISGSFSPFSSRADASNGPLPPPCLISDAVISKSGSLT